MRYRILGYKTIKTSLLVPHPDAQAYPTDQDDRAALDASVAGVGILEPLTVMESESNQLALVIDGIGRMEEALRAGLSEVPCLVVECDDPRGFAAQKNAMGRKRSTGSRVLTYVLANLKRVAEAATLPPERSRDLSGRVANKIPADLTDWTAKSIAARLKVSEKDAQLAIQLATCQTCGAGPDGEDLDEEAKTALDEVFTAVLSGRTPVRRWRAALGGLLVPADGSGKAAANWADVAARAAVSLRGVFGHWQDVPFSARGPILDALREALEAAPDDVRAVVEAVAGSARPAKPARK